MLFVKKRSLPIYNVGSYNFSIYIILTCVKLIHLLKIALKQLGIKLIFKILKCFKFQWVPFTLLSIDTIKLFNKLAYKNIQSKYIKLLNKIYLLNMYYLNHSVNKIN